MLLQWALVKHFSNRAARRRRARGCHDASEDEESEYGNDDFTQHEIDGGSNSKILIVRKSYRLLPSNGHHSTNGTWAAAADFPPPARALAPVVVPGRAHNQSTCFAASPGMSRARLVGLEMIEEDEEKAEEDDAGGS